MELLLALIVIGIPTAGIVACIRAKEKRLENTNEDRLKYLYHLRQMELEHEQRVLALPEPRNGDEP